MLDLSTEAGEDDGVCLLLILIHEAHVDFQVGKLDSEIPAAIRLSGENILEEHCCFENTEGKVTLTSLPGSVTVRL